MNDPIEIGISLLIATIIPLAFLILAYSLDLYNVHSAAGVLIAFVWGGVLSLGLAYLINTQVTVPLLRWLNLGHLLLYIVFAPLVEEVLKLTPLAVYLQRGKITFFVDGAIYGFAAGIGFAIGETFLYINQHPDLAIPLAIGRAFSTSLMHGSATALVGIGYGLARLRRLQLRKLLANAMWVTAVAVHGLFNALILLDPQDMLGLWGAVAVALGSFELTLTFIRLGLQQEKRWLEEGLDAAMVTPFARDLSPLEREQLAHALNVGPDIPLVEIRASQDYEQIDEFLAPLREQFPEYAYKMEQIIFQQAQTAIKRRLIWEVDDAKLQARLQAEIAKLETDIKRLRKQVGVCALSYLDCVFDEDGKLMQVCVETVTSCAAPWSNEEALPGALTAAT